MRRANSQRARTISPTQATPVQTLLRHADVKVTPYLDRTELVSTTLRTVLRTRKKGSSETVAVTLHARLTEIGTLDLWCSEVGGRRSWRLQFDVRSATQTDVAAHEFNQLL